MIDFIRKEWCKKGCFYRTVRTAWQAFLATAMSELTLLLSGTVELSWRILLSTVLIPAISAAIAAVMNVKEPSNIAKNKEEELIKNE